MLAGLWAEWRFLPLLGREREAEASKPTETLQRCVYWGHLSVCLTSNTTIEAALHRGSPLSAYEKNKEKHNGGFSSSLLSINIPFMYNMKKNNPFLLYFLGCTDVYKTVRSVDT